MKMRISAGLLQLLMLSLMVTRTSAERGAWKESDGNYEYYASSPGVSKSYTDSLNECKNMDGLLATIKSQEIQNFMNTLFNGEGGHPFSFFIGLRQSASGSFVWDDGESLKFDNWKEGEPNDPKLQRCAAAGEKYTAEKDLKWNNIACSTKTKVGFFCQRLIGQIWTGWGSWSECVCPGMQQRERYCNDTGRSGPDSCTLSGESTTQNRTCWSSECNITTIAVTTTPRPLVRGQWFPSGGFEYYVSPSGKGVSYQQSQAKCRESDGELAFVKSAEVHSFIASLVVDGSGFPYGFYIGLKHDAGKNGFIWTDGSALNFTNWHAGEPNRLTKLGEDCVGMGSNYELKEGLPWYDYECETGSTGKKGSVCQRRIGSYWGEWSSCSCVTTNQSRSRTCLDSGRDGPKPCTALDNETKVCPNDSSCYQTITLPYEVITERPVGWSTTKLPQTSTLSTEKTKVITSAIPPFLQETTTLKMEAATGSPTAQSHRISTFTGEYIVATTSALALVVSKSLLTTHGKEATESLQIFTSSSEDVDSFSNEATDQNVVITTTVGIGILVLAAIVTSLLLFRRRHKSKKQEIKDKIQNDDRSSPIPIPLTLTAPLSNADDVGYATISSDPKYCTITLGQLEAKYETPFTKEEWERAQQRRIQELESTTGYCSVNVVSQFDTNDQGYILMKPLPDESLADDIYENVVVKSQPNGATKHTEQNNSN